MFAARPCRRSNYVLGVVLFGRLSPSRSSRSDCGRGSRRVASPATGCHGLGWGTKMGEKAWRVLAVAVTAALALGGSSAATAQERVSHAGGTYRLAYESSFGFSDGFDPTGEYLARRSGSTRTSLMRTLVGYNHVAGAAGNKLVPDIATLGARRRRTAARPTRSISSAGVKFGPPVTARSRRRTCVYAFERLANPKNGAQYGFYYSRDRGLERIRRRQGEDDLRHRHAGRVDDRLPAEAAQRRLPLPRSRCRPPAPSRPRSPVLRGQARRVRPQRRLDRAVHDRGRRTSSTHRPARTLKPISGPTPDAAEPRPQPQLRGSDRLESGAREPSGPVRVHRSTRT